MAIRIKRSSGDSAPSSLAAGQMAYVEGSTNGGTLYYGEIGGTVREIAGKKFIDKLTGIEAGAEVNTVDSVNGQTGTVVIDTDDLASFNTDVDARITSSAITTALGFTPESSANKNEANGYAGLDSNGKVASAQLPSYVDDVVESANFAALPATGETGKIYVLLDSGFVYRWSGSVYVEISASPGSTDAVSEGATNLYFTNARARAAISVTQNLSYNDSTGVITGPDLSSYLTSVALNDVSDVTIITPLSTGQALVYNGIATQWENTTLNFLSSVQGDASPQLGGNLSVGSYSIVAPVNNDINITPSGTGNVVISGQAFPGADGDANQVLKTDGSGNLSWTTLGAGVSAIDDLSDVTISSPTTGQILTYTMSGQWENQNAPAGGIASVSADTNPALGGNLDLADYEITNTLGNITIATQEGASNIYLSTDTGYVYLNDLKFPTDVGTNGQVLKTDGSGNLSWTTVESFSGDYNDLSNKPTLFSGDYDDLSNKPSLVTTFTGLSDTPALYTAFGGAIVRVNSAATGLEFTSDLDDGTF